MYPASLNTLDAIYIHLVAFETGNFMSTGHEAHAQDDFRLIESSLFARIPFDRSTFTEVHEVVQYVDAGNDMFQSFPLRKHRTHHGAPDICVYRRAGSKGECGCHRYQPHCRW